ncbi:MAG: acyloxyacyl hydrolase [Vicinamibacterales bacterium]
MSLPGKAFVFGALIVASVSAPAGAQEAPVGEGFRTRGLIGGWGHSWRPIFGQTQSEITFVAFHPRMGWFVTDRLELYGEGTVFLYDRPQAALAAGLGGLAGRYYLKTSGGWVPYVHAGAGLLWTSLDVPEIDRTFNFQLFMGVGWRQTRDKGPCLVFEFRNHHISNADTVGRNLGINAATILAGIEWVLRP